MSCGVLWGPTARPALAAGPEASGLFPVWVMCAFLLRWGRLLWVCCCAGLAPAQPPGRPCLVALLWAHWWAGRPPGATGPEGGFQDCAHQPWCQPRDRDHRNDCSQHPSPQGPAAACFSGSLSGTHRWSGPGPSLLEFRLCESLCTASGSRGCGPWAVTTRHWLLTSSCSEAPQVDTLPSPWPRPAVHLAPPRVRPYAGRRAS